MNQKLFFDKQFNEAIDVRNAALQVGSVLPESKNLISGSLEHLSAESIRNRFLGNKKAFSEQELDYFTRLDGYNHYAIGIKERGGEQRGVAVIRLVRSLTDKSEGEIAITIIDRYQRIGLGTILLKLIILAAYERDFKCLSLTFLPQNEGIVKLINKIGTPIPGNQNRDYHQLYLDLESLDLAQIKSQLASYLQSIDTFHLKT